MWDYFPLSAGVSAKKVLWTRYDHSKEINCAGSHQGLFLIWSPRSIEAREIQWQPGSYFSWCVSLGILVLQCPESVLTCRVVGERKHNENSSISDGFPDSAMCIVVGWMLAVGHLICLLAGDLGNALFNVEEKNRVKMWHNHSSQPLSDHRCGLRAASIVQGCDLGNAGHAPSQQEVWSSCASSLLLCWIFANTAVKLYSLKAQKSVLTASLLTLS